MRLDSPRSMCKTGNLLGEPYVRENWEGAWLQTKMKEEREGRQSGWDGLSLPCSLRKDWRGYEDVPKPVTHQRRSQPNNEPTSPPLPCSLIGWKLPQEVWPEHEQRDFRAAQLDLLVSHTPCSWGRGMQPSGHHINP